MAKSRLSATMAERTCQTARYTVTLSRPRAQGHPYPNSLHQTRPARCFGRTSLPQRRWDDIQHLSVRATARYHGL